MNEAVLSLVAKIGWTLLHFTWQGLVLGLATAMALACMPRARPEQRYLVACSALFLCLAWPAWELLGRIHSPAFDSLAQGVFESKSGAGARTTLVSILQNHLVWIVGLWAVCAALLALRMGLGLLWIAKTAKRPLTHPEWQSRVTRMAAGWGITRTVRVRLVDGLASPLTAGWLRPVILLPTALATGMPPELLNALLAHELAHIRRFDYLVNLGQNLVETLLFYHPAVWWISGQIRIERELIADDLAATRLATPRTLALALSELEKYQSARHHLALGANGGELAQRIGRLLRPGAHYPGWGGALSVIGLVIACAALVAQAQPARTAVVTTQARANFASCTKPMYPAASLRAGHTGAVDVRFLIGVDGKVKSSALARSSGHPALDTAAREAIALCRFSPGLADTTPVESWVSVRYVWVLK